MLWFQAHLCQWSSYLFLENMCAGICPRDHLLYLGFKGNAGNLGPIEMMGIISEYLPS